LLCASSFSLCLAYGQNVAALQNQSNANRPTAHQMPNGKRRFQLPTNKMARSDVSN
jgi:hypothetical protein